MPRAKTIAVKPRPTRQLRQRKTTNYLEKTLENSTQSDLDTSKDVKAPVHRQSLRDNPPNSGGSALKNGAVRVPVYRQLLDNFNKNKPSPNRKSKAKDLYQFDESDPEPAVKKKRNRLKTNKPNKANKPKTVVMPQNLKAKKLDKYDGKIQDILKKVMTKVKERKDVPANQAIRNTKVPVLATTKSAGIPSEKSPQQAENFNSVLPVVVPRTTSQSPVHAIVMSAQNKNSCRQPQPIVELPKTTKLPSEKLTKKTRNCEQTVVPEMSPEIVSYSPVHANSGRQSQETAEKLNGTSAKNTITVTVDVHNEASFDPYRSIEVFEEQTRNCVETLEKPTTVSAVVTNKNQASLQLSDSENCTDLVKQTNTVPVVPNKNRTSSQSVGLQNRVDLVQKTITVPMIVPNQNQAGNCVNVVNRTITVPMVQNAIDLRQVQNQSQPQRKSSVCSQSKDIPKDTIKVSADVHHEADPQNDHSSEPVHDDDSTDSQDESCFGFSSTDSSPQKSKKSPNKVNIISKVILSPDSEFVWSPGQFRRTKPKANSTMLFKNNRTKTPPWRFNGVNFRRNPHFITLKEDALPCLHQDAVLNHTLVDRFESISLQQKTPKKVSENSPEPKNCAKKSPVQKTIEDCFNHSSGKQNNFEPSLQKSSLFDNEEFSPIKPQKTQKKPEIEAAKRNILGALDTNVILNNNGRVQSASTPKKSKDAAAPSAQGQENRLTYFGFNSSSDEAELSPRKISISKQKAHKPFRLSMNENDRKYVPRKTNLKKVVEVAPVQVSEPEGSSSDNDDDQEGILSDIDMMSDQPKGGRETPAAQARLFEDLERPQEINELDAKLTKRKKYKWMTSGNQNKKPRKKTKDIRTKYEEDEAEKWYSKFNLECNEVENFPLEIE